MTTGSNPDVNPARRRWAAEVLGVREGASPPEARRAYLRRLPEADFLPPPSWHKALRVLDGRPAPAGPDEGWLVEEEARLHAEVASFAEEFFTLPVAQRRERWDALASRCENVPPLVVRLQALKAGLEVEKQGLPLDGSPGGQLAEHLLQSFPLRPLARAASRQTFLRQIEESSADSHKLWEKAARYLWAEWPALAALDKELVQHVAELRIRLKRRGKTHRSSQRNPQPAAAADSQSGSRWWIFLVVGIVAILRAGLSSDRSSPRPPPWSGYSASPDGARVKDREHLRERMAIDWKSAVQSTKPFLRLPPIQELFDPAKYDIEALNPAGPRLLRFTPRPGSTITGPDSPLANRGKPVFLGEATLILLGVSRQQIDALYSRAAGRKPRDSAPSKPREEKGPKAPKSARGDETRP